MTFSEYKKVLPDALFSSQAGNQPNLWWGFSDTGKGLSRAARTTAAACFSAAREKDAPSPAFGRLAKAALGQTEILDNAVCLLAILRVLPLWKETAADDFADAAESAARDAAGIFVEEQPLEYLLLAVELPVTLAYVQPQRENLLELAQTAIRSFYDAFLDGDGTPVARFLDSFRQVLASFVRMRLMLKAEDRFPTELVDIFDLVVQRALCLTRADGTQVFSNAHEGTAEWCPELFVAALQLDSEAADKRLGVSVLPGMTRVKKRLPKDLPNGSNVSEWARLGTIRSRWEGPNAAVKWTDDTLDVELSHATGPIFSGAWSFQATFDGKPLMPNGAWRLVQWHSYDEYEHEDEESAKNGGADCLTLELALSAGFRLLRHIVFAKRDGIALLADALLPSRNRRGALTYVGRLPLFTGVTLTGEREALELRTKNALFLPLALPEWKTQCSANQSFQTANGALEYACESAEGGLFAPIFCVFDTCRKSSVLTWRPLTVGEEMRQISPARANGFRVQIAESQWLIYQSLTNRAAKRTLMGHHLNDLETFLVAKFTDEGEVEALYPWE